MERTPPSWLSLLVRMLPLHAGAAAVAAGLGAALALLEGQWPTWAPFVYLCAGYAGAAVALWLLLARLEQRGRK
jgi:hypothetical protein